MDRGTAIDCLPEAYANALRLYDQGHDNEAIAARSISRQRQSARYYVWPRQNFRPSSPLMKATHDLVLIRAPAASAPRQTEARPKPTEGTGVQCS